MASHPAPAGDLLHLDRLRAGARGLQGDALPPHTLATALGKHDGPDHGDQQHQTGGLDQVDVVGVAEAAERPGVVHVAWRRHLLADRWLIRRGPDTGTSTPSPPPPT